MNVIDSSDFYDLYSWCRKTYNPTVITPVIWSGFIDGSQFENPASAAKLFVARKIILRGGSGPKALIQDEIFINTNSAETDYLTAANSVICYNSTADEYQILENIMVFEAIHFYSIDLSACFSPGQVSMYFQGYRFTIP